MTTFTFDRPLTEDERALATHISMFGSAGYPVRKLGRKWTWDYRSISAPTLYATKRDATAAFERYMGVIRSCLGAAAYRRAIAEQEAR